MKKILLVIGFFVALNTEAQVVNKFRDSSVFFKGVRFDSTLVFKGLKAGSTADTNVVVISSTGKASKVSKSAFLGDLPIYSISDSNTVINYDVLNSQNTPPVSPSTGDVYLIGTVPTGAWVGHAKDIAEWNGSAWVFTDGVQGDFLYNATNALTYIFRSGNWVQTTGIPALHNGNTISSGLKIGTRNNKDFNFISNNILRGGMLANGSFRVANQGGSGNVLVGADSLGVQRKLYIGDGLSLSNDSLLASGGGGSSSLFPNGIKIVTEDYAFQASDAGKIIYISGNEITVGFDYEAPNPFKQGDYVGVIDAGSIVDGSTGNAVIYSLNNEPIQILPATFAESQAVESEILTIINQDSPANDGSVVSTVLGGVIEGKTSAKYFYDKSQNANSYSTDEIKTGGTWIDGKPIYRKVFVGNIAEDTSINISSLNIEKIIKIYSDMKDLDDNYYNGYLEQSEVIVDGVDILLNIVKRGATYFFPDSDLQIKNSFIKYKLSDGSVFSSGYNLQSIYDVIIEYTKTTD